MRKIKIYFSYGTFDSNDWRLQFGLHAHWGHSVVAIKPESWFYIGIQFAFWFISVGVIGKVMTKRSYRER